MISSGEMVLDIGCANGVLAKEIRKRGNYVVGVDTMMSEKAKNNCNEFIQMDVEKNFNLNFEKEFDCIIFADVLEHLRNPLQILRACKRFLKPSGKIILSVPNVANWYIRLNLLFGRFDYKSRGILDESHVRFFTWKSLKELLEEAKLEIKKIEVTPIPFLTVFLDESHNSLYETCLNFLCFLNYWLAKVWKKLFAYQFVVLVTPKGDF